MQTKTYFASSVPAALEAARRELGEDAMLVTSKLSSDAARGFGRLEVTFAFDPKPDASSGVKHAALSGVRPPAFPAVTREGAPPALKPVRGAADPENRNFASELDEIRGQLSALKQAAVRPAIREGVRMMETRSAVAQRLSQQGLSEDIAEEIAVAARASDAPDALARELDSRLEVATFPDPKQGESRLVALVGPPGRGKTTTIVKIALRFGLAKRVPVKIYMTGSHAVGCEDQMAKYASILGVPFHACESLEGLGLALNGEMWKGLVLIDTPGISPGDGAEIGDLAKFFKRRPEIEKHLVLRADARSADITNVIKRYSAMEISRLLFTGLDEAVNLGSMADAMIRSRIPAALAGTGQRIPEDIETVSTLRLARFLQEESALAAAAA